MTAKAKTRRRWFGGLCLLAALIMLVFGVTIIEGRLSGISFVGYWLGCLVLTVLAAGTALVDAASVRAEQRSEQRALIESALHEIERKKRSRRDALD